MEKLYEGKSKVVYSSEEPGTCIIKYKDTATAGNGVKKEDLPGKGRIDQKPGGNRTTDSGTLAFPAG